MQSTSTPNSISKVEKKKQKKNEGKDNEEIVLESDQDVEDRILAGDSIVFPESKWGQDMTFDSVANTRTYLPTSDDVGRLLRLSVDVAEQNIKKSRRNRNGYSHASTTTGSKSFDESQPTTTPTNTWQ